MGARPRFGLSVPSFVQVVLLLTPVVLLLTGCTTDNPQNTLTDRGDVSARATFLYRLPFWIAVAVFIFVEGLLLYTAFRFRERSDRTELPVQTHGNTRLEIGWTIVPAVILGALVIPTISGIVWLSDRPENAQPVRIIGHQFWWEFRYPGPNNQEIVVANELHIPVGRRVLGTIESVDVIHSFWVPSLAGKQDAVPGHRNDIWFNAREAGVYSGQCAEFCGESHALMRFVVIAEPEEQFNAWLANQARAAVGTQPASTPGATAPAGSVGPSPGVLSPSAQRGSQVFLGNACIGCHAIAGTNAQGISGPNLTHFGTRSTIAANRLPNTPENLERWIRNPTAIKPGVKMPAWEGVLSDDDIRALVDYLGSLK